MAEHLNDLCLVSPKIMSLFMVWEAGLLRRQSDVLGKTLEVSSFNHY